MTEFRRSEEAKTAFRKSMYRRISFIQDSIINLEEELLNSRNWFAVRGIQKNLRERKAQLNLYLRRWDRYITEGWI